MSSILRKYFIKNEQPQIYRYIEKNQKDQPRTTFAKSIILKPINHYVQEKNNKGYLTRSIDSRSRIHTVIGGIQENANAQYSKECSTLDFGIGRRKQSKKKCEIFPMRKLEPVRLMKRPSSSSLSASYLKMASSRTKPTDKLFCEKDNIRLVERLLMARATK